MEKPKIYIGHGKSAPITKAIRLITDDWVNQGQCCDQTILDLRDACKYLLSENKKLKKNETI